MQKETYNVLCQFSSLFFFQGTILISLFSRYHTLTPVLLFIVQRSPLFGWTVKKGPESVANQTHQGFSLNPSKLKNYMKEECHQKKRNRYRIFLFLVQPGHWPIGPTHISHFTFFTLYLYKFKIKNIRSMFFQSNLTRRAYWTDPNGPNSICTNLFSV